MTVSHEMIERAFKAPAEIIEKLPETTETREVRRLLTVAEQLTHETRERTQPCND